jgi:hypothetical protein
LPSLIINVHLSTFIPTQHKTAESLPQAFRSQILGDRGHSMTIKFPTRAYLHVQTLVSVDDVAAFAHVTVVAAATLAGVTNIFLFCIFET